MGRKPYLVTADAAFFSQRNEAAAQARGVKRVAIPNRSTKSAQRKRLQKKRWFRNAQKWRTGCEGRISLLKRRHGLNRCRYKGLPGIKRWVGFGVIADNLINIGHALAASADALTARQLPKNPTSIALPPTRVAADLSCSPPSAPERIPQGHFCAGK